MRFFSSKIPKVEIRNWLSVFLFTFCYTEKKSGDDLRADLNTGRPCYIGCHKKNEKKNFNVLVVYIDSTLKLEYVHDLWQNI